jgi:hypothetical protein
MRRRAVTPNKSATGLGQAVIDPRLTRKDLLRNRNLVIQVQARHRRRSLTKGANVHSGHLDRLTHPVRLAGFRSEAELRR